mgnify:CR=1 FL=1
MDIFTFDFFFISFISTSIIFYSISFKCLWIKNILRIRTSFLPSLPYLSKELDFGWIKQHFLKCIIFFILNLICYSTPTAFFELFQLRIILLLLQIELFMMCRSSSVISNVPYLLINVHLIYKLIEHVLLGLFFHQFRINSCCLRK